jgi:uridylate kinase
LQNKRILVKLSGEVLAGGSSSTVDKETIVRVCDDLVAAHREQYEIGVVIGGGNICRGTSGGSIGINRVTADYMGMLATVINALALQSFLESAGVEARVLSAISMPTVCEPYARRRALHHIENGRIVIFAAGSGNPYFSTDTAAALRASEICCSLLLKGTKVAGVYEEDPTCSPNARFFSSLTYKDVLARDLCIMDPSAITLARENNIPIVVFSILESGNLLRTLHGEGAFTTIHGGGRDVCGTC